MKKGIIGTIMAAIIVTSIFSTAVLAEDMGGTSMQQSTTAAPAAEMASETTQQGTANMNVELKFAGEKAALSDKTFTLILMDTNDQPISGAQVKVTFDMVKNGMNDMSMYDPEVVTLTPGSNAGEYTGDINLYNHGAWTAMVEYAANGKTQSTQLNFDVENSGPNWIVIGGFIGAVAVIIVTAAVLKKKKSAKA